MSDTTDLNDIERDTLQGFRAGAAISPRTDMTDPEWARFGLRCLLESCRLLRGSFGMLVGDVSLKQDGSPATRLEHDVEQGIRARLREFDPSAAFVGEETGGGLPDSGLAVAVDPVDGTWAFLTDTGTWASTLAVFRDGEAIAGFVASPVTGELAYALASGPTRCLRVSTFGEGDSVLELPSGPLQTGKLLVNLHPSRSDEAMRKVLYAAWNRSELRMVRSPGGSPAWGLLEAARGHFIYVNAWSGRPAEPFDLAAGVLLVRGAGGEVTDLDGAPIDSLRHAGPWLAGLDSEACALVAALIRDVDCS